MTSKWSTQSEYLLGQMSMWSRLFSCLLLEVMTVLRPHSLQGGCSAKDSLTPRPSRCLPRLGPWRDASPPEDVCVASAPLWRKRRSPPGKVQCAVAPQVNRGLTYTGQSPVSGTAASRPTLSHSHSGSRSFSGRVHPHPEPPKRLSSGSTGAADLKRSNSGAARELRHSDSRSRSSNPRSSRSGLIVWRVPVARLNRMSCLFIRSSDSSSDERPSLRDSKPDERPAGVSEGGQSSGAGPKRSLKSSLSRSVTPSAFGDDDVPLFRLKNEDW
jgi:hypothetical protein